MNVRTETRPTAGELFDEGAALSAGVGMIVMVLFPFALPAIILAGVVLVPLVLLGLVGAVPAAPVLAVRALRRRSGARRADLADRAEASRSAPPVVRVARP